MAQGHHFKGGRWSATDFVATETFVDNTGETEETPPPTGNQNQCNSHDECGTGYYCHSGWDGFQYNIRSCVQYHADYCKNNPCGAGDGDCDRDDHCGGWEEPDNYGTEIKDAYKLVCGTNNANYSQNFGDICDISKI